MQVGNYNISKNEDGDTVISCAACADCNITFNGKKYKLVPVEPEKKPFPQVGDKYWFINASGSVCKDSFYGTEIDRERLSIGNMYQTEQAAENALRALKLIKTINDRRKELNGDWVADWENEDQTRWHIDTDLSAEECFSYIQCAYPFGAFKNEYDCYIVIKKHESDLLCQGVA